METSKNLIELLDSMPATINVNGVTGALSIRKLNGYLLTYSAAYMGDGLLPLEVEVDDGRVYAISIGNTLEDCLIDLKERIKKYI